MNHQHAREMKIRGMQGAQYATVKRPQDVIRNPRRWQAAVIPVPSLCDVYPSLAKDRQRIALSCRERTHGPTEIAR